jgi:hypothetical protein
MDKDRLLEQAERCRRIADKINEPTAAEALRRLADDYQREADAIGRAGRKSEDE